MSAASDQKLTQWCVATLYKMELPTLARRVRVVWNSRLRSTAGRSWWPQGQIELNPRIRDFGHSEVSRTLRHELAHLVASQWARGRRIQPHGVEWRSACAKLGIANESALHDLPLPQNRVMRRYRYKCPECHMIYRRARLIRGARACGRCCKKYANNRYHKRFRLQLVKAQKCSS